MQSSIHIKTHILPGQRIEITTPELQPGEEVDVFVMRRPATDRPRRSAIDILAEAPGHRLFRTATEVETYLQEERAAWDH